MQRYTRRIGLVAAAAAVAALAAPSTSLAKSASAKTGIPDQPRLSASKTAKVKSPRRLLANTAQVSVGYDPRAGFEVWVTRVDGSVVGMPYG